MLGEGLTYKPSYPRRGYEGYLPETSATTQKTRARKIRNINTAPSIGTYGHTRGKARDFRIYFNCLSLAIALAHKFTAISAGPGGAMIDSLVASALAP